MPQRAGSDTQWTQIIEPHGHEFDLKLGELWRYRDLVYLFVHRDFVAQYKQTILGPAWHRALPDQAQVEKQWRQRNRSYRASRSGDHQ